MRMSLALTVPFICAVALPGKTNKPKPAADYSQFQKKLSKDDQIIHTLDRLTFGPKPGDLEAVKKLGLKKWIDQQLHPENVKENPELARKLAPLESLRMNQAETVAKYPPPQLIRAVAQGRQPAQRHWGHHGFRFVHPQHYQPGRRL